MSIEFPEPVDNSFARQPLDQPERIPTAAPLRPITAVADERATATGNNGDMPKWLPTTAVHRAVGAAAAQAETPKASILAVQASQENDGRGVDRTKDSAKDPEPTQDPPATASSGGNDTPPTDHPPAPGAAEPDEPKEPTAHSRLSAIVLRPAIPADDDGAGVQEKPHTIDQPTEGSERAALGTDTPTKAKNEQIHATEVDVVAVAAAAVVQADPSCRAHVVGTFTGYKKASLQIVEFGSALSGEDAILDATYQSASSTIQLCRAYQDAHGKFDEAGTTPDVYAVDEHWVHHPYEDGYVQVQEIHAATDDSAVNGPELMTRTIVYIPQVDDKEMLYATFLSREGTVLSTLINAASPEQEVVYQRCREAFGEDSLAAAIAEGKYEPGPALEAELERFQSAARDVGVYSPDEINDIVARLREVAPAAYEDNHTNDGIRPDRLDRLATFIQGFIPQEGQTSGGQPTTIDISVASVPIGAKPVADEALGHPVDYGMPHAPSLGSRLEATEVIFTSREAVELAAEVVTGESARFRSHTVGVVDASDIAHFKVSEQTKNSLAVNEQTVIKMSSELAARAKYLLRTNPECRSLFGMTDLRLTHLVDDHATYRPSDSGFVRVQKIYETFDNGATRGDEIATVTMVRVPTEDDQGAAVFGLFFSRQDVDTVVSNITVVSPKQPEVRTRCQQMFGEISMAADILSGLYEPGLALNAALAQLQEAARAVGVYSEAELDAVVADLRELAPFTYANRHGHHNLNPTRLNQICKFLQTLHD